MSFEIELSLFKGPFDLLLFFIERDELDINDIPISKITNDFLDYLHHLEKMNIEVASEFILVAASLMKIKSKMLVPRPEIDDEGNKVDPRTELVQRLLEYRKYKSVLEELSTLETTRLSKQKRGNAVKEIKKLAEINNVELELQEIDLYKLLKVFKKAIEHFDYEQAKPIHQVVQYAYTITEQKTLLLDKLDAIDKISFTDLISTDKDKIAVIFNFLSILELLQLKMISIKVGIGYNNFWISRFDESN